MILFDWLKRQGRGIKKKTQSKIGASPSRAFADFGRCFVHGWESGSQKATLKTIHQMPKVPYQLWTTPYFNNDPRTPSEFWEWWNN